MAAAAVLFLMPALAAAQFERGNWELTLAGVGTSNKDFDEHAIGVIEGAVRALAAHIAPDHERAAHGRITIFNPVPDRIVSKASPILSSGKRCVTTRERSSWRRSR